MATPAPDGGAHVRSAHNTDFVRVRAHGLNWRVAPEFADVLSSVDVLRLRTPHKLKDFQLIKDNNARTVVRVPHPGNPDGPGLYVKRFKLPGLGRRLKHLFVPTQAEKEWRMSRALRARGIPTCKVLAVAERRVGLLHAEAFLVSEEILDAAPLRLLFAGPDCEEVGPSTKHAVIAELAEMVARMIREGVHHRDLHIGNLLFNPDAPSGSRLHVLDLHRADLTTLTDGQIARMLAFLADSTWKSSRLSSLILSVPHPRPLPKGEGIPPPSGRGKGEGTSFPNAQLQTGRSTSVTSSDRIRFLRLVLAKWLGERGEAEQTLRAWARRVGDAWRDRRRRHMHSRTRRCLLETTEFTRDSAGGFRIFRRRDWPTDTILGIVEAHRAAMGGSHGACGVRKSGPRAEITRCTGIGARPVFVKAFLRRGLMDRLKDILRPCGRARDAWVAHRGLRVRGLPAPQGVALLEARGKLAGRPDYIITEAVDAVGDLQQIAFGLGPDGSPRPEPVLSATERGELPGAIADLFRSLAESRTRHRDMKPSNILVSRREDGLHLWLVDLERARFDVEWRREHWVHHLAQCDSGLPAGVTLLGRMRCLRRCGVGRWTPAERLRVARDVPCGVAPTGGQVADRQRRRWPSAGARRRAGRTRVT